MITPIRLTAALALLGIIFGVVSCRALGARPPVNEAVEIDSGAIEACQFYRTRLNASGEGKNDMLVYLANGCGAVLTDLTRATDLDEASILHGELYLQAITKLHKATLTLSQTYRDGGEGRTEPSNSGEFLMARRLDVMHHFSSWRAAWSARHPG